MQKCSLENEFDLIERKKHGQVKQISIVNDFVQRIFLTKWQEAIQECLKLKLEIPGGFSCKNMISSHVKISCFIFFQSGMVTNPAI